MSLTTDELDERFRILEDILNVRLDRIERKLDLSLDILVGVGKKQKIPMDEAERQVDHLRLRDFWQG